MKRTWSVWSITWLSLVAITAASVLVSAGLARTATTDALVHGLEDHVTAQAGLVGAAMSDVPVETVVLVGGTKSRDAVAERLETLEAAGRLHAVALLGPDDVVLAAEPTWLPGSAERDLIARAVAGETVAGPLYTADDGQPYMTAYHPLDGHPGWVAAVEGSGATLQAADELQSNLLWMGLFVLAAVSLAALGVAGVLALPLVRLDRALSEAAPHRETTVPVGGPREVRNVATTVNSLLEQVRERDAALAAQHDARLEELTRLAAGVAHEIRNPLNAMALTAQRMGRMSAGERRDALGVRLLDQVDQLEVIVRRLVDLTAPVEPALETHVLEALIAEVARDTRLDVTIEGSATVRADRGMVLQVIRNLVLNAEQAEATRLQATLSVEGAVAIARFEDDGAGVPEASVPYLFDWFHTTRAQGTGLGLPQSRRLVEAMGGALVLHRPSPTTFELRIPQP